MAGVTLDAAKCVRAVSKFSACTHCSAICPTGAIVIAPEALPAINFSQCVGCGGCSGICPSEALRLDDFDPTEFFFAFTAQQDDLLSCRKNVPCLSVLNVEHIIALASMKGTLRFDMGHCEGCEIAHTCKPQIEKSVDEALYVLEATENPATVTMEMTAYEAQESADEETPDRRDFFRSFNLKNAVASKNRFEREVEIATDELVEHMPDSEQIARIRQKQIPDKRKLLFTALKRVQKPSVYHVVDAGELSFTSQKLVDEAACTACQMCYRICPTGALSSDGRNSKIDFDPFLCIKCHICHDVCEPDAITLSPSYNMKELFEPSVKNLVTFTVKNCNECAAPFVSLKGEKLCYRCQCEEDEARELWGIE